MWLVQYREPRDGGDRLFTYTPALGLWKVNNLFGDTVSWDPLSTGCFSAGFIAPSQPELCESILTLFWDPSGSAPRPSLASALCAGKSPGLG